MSGLETAIRNALDRSDRADGQTRARIYQSARQALDAGLRRQGVSDALIIMQQQKRLEEKIREIEKEEIDKLTEVEVDPTLPDDAFEVAPIATNRTEPKAMGDFLLQGATRDVATDAGPAVVSPVSRATAQNAPVSPTPSVGSPALDEPGLDTPADFDAGRPPQTQPAGDMRSEARKSGSRKRRATLDVPPERAAKPRKRRGFLSRMATWIVTLAIVAGACWYFYNSGMVQSVVQEAIQAADRASRGQGEAGGNPSFDPRGGFSSEWVQIFKPSDVASVKAGSQANAEAVQGSEGPAARIVSSDPGAGGDVAIDVPADLLRQMAAKTSTIALTVQSAANQAAQLSVRCDFGSLGSCSRHRFTATQERLEALFSVTFDHTLAPNAPGHLIINAGIDGPDKSVLLYSVRILPGH